MERGPDHPERPWPFPGRRPSWGLPLLRAPARACVKMCAHRARPLVHIHMRPECLDRSTWAAHASFRNPSQVNMDQAVGGTQGLATAPLPPCARHVTGSVPAPFAHSCQQGHGGFRCSRHAHGASWLHLAKLQVCKHQPSCADTSAQTLRHLGPVLPPTGFLSFLTQVTFHPSNAPFSALPSSSANQAWWAWAGREGSGVPLSQGSPYLLDPFLLPFCVPSHDLKPQWGLTLSPAGVQPQRVVVQAVASPTPWRGAASARRRDT